MCIASYQINSIRTWFVALTMTAALHAGAQTWSFTPPRDTFSADALLDLRTLNERVAGEAGFVRSNAEGDFVRGDGKPIRFWAVNTNVAERTGNVRPLWPQGAPDLARHARFLAKRGVNMVRLHQQISPDLKAKPSATIDDINETQRDAIWRTVAAMRKEGIYTTLSPYWASPMKFAPGWNFPGGSEQSAQGLLFFDPTLQKAYRAWLRKLLTEKNPYTGIALVDDPSVAILQLQNEDSLLFWSFNSIKGAQRQALERLFATFLSRKYGTLVKVQDAWAGAQDAGDTPQDGRMALLNLWELTQPPRDWPLIGDPKDLRGGKAVRRADQTEFLARTMYDFNAAMVRFLRDELGAKQLINAGNWKTGSTELLNDAERWSYTAADVDAANVYNGGIHKGKHNGWAIIPGDQFTSESILLSPQLLPINLKQTQGRPMLLTEGNWVMPNNFGAEGPFLIAAYASLTGVDGYYWFATGDEGWTPPQSANGYLPNSQGKWIFATPEILGSFPAAALAYRMGYIARGAPVLQETRSVQDLWQRKPPLLSEATSFDPNRDSGDRAKAASATSRVPGSAFLVGPVQVTLGKEGALPSRVTDFSAAVRPDAVQSNTGQLLWNTQLGYCTVDAPEAQGVVAHFGKAPDHQLKDVRFTSTNAFGAAMAVSMDGAPLNQSRRILLQYATQSRPNGWREAPATLALDGSQQVSGFTVEAVGQSPWLVQQAKLDVVIRNPHLRSATVLDMNGMPVHTVELKRVGNNASLRFPANAMYVVLQ
jgi:hypothetical protein